MAMVSATDYSSPFELSMTIKTSPLMGYGSKGIIYSDRGPQSLIEIRWSMNSSIEFVISNAHINKRLKTEVISMDTEFDLKLIYDGDTCKWLINNEEVESTINCSKGLGEMGNPMLCHASNDGWHGFITDLKFEKKGIYIPYSILIINFSNNL